MPQKVLRFTGINRRVNEFQGTGACEELINLRPDISGGHKVVKTKDIVLSNVQYDWIYEHSYGNVYNTIAVTNGVVQWIDITDGSVKQKVTDEFESKDVSICSAGNVVLVYCEEEKKQVVFRFKDEKYSVFNPPVSTIEKVEVGYHFSEDISYSNTAVVDGLNEGAYNDALNKAVSGFHDKHTNGFCGACVIGFTYELADGSEIMSSEFRVINITKNENFTQPKIALDLSKKTGSVTVFGASDAYVEIKKSSVDDDSDIKSINVYATRPVFPYKISGDESKFKGETYEGFIFDNKPLDDEDLAGQLMYFQGKVAADNGGTERVYLNFGNSQAGEKVMEVDSGCVERVGKAISYNNRFHYFRSNVDHYIQQPTVSTDGTGDSRWIAYVKINNKWQMIGNKVYKFNMDTPAEYIYPLSGIKELAFVKLVRGLFDTEYSCDYTQVFFMGLKDSSAYNYSFHFDAWGTLTSEQNALKFYEEVKKDNQIYGGTFDTKVFLKEETNAINVSAQYNPFVFPVEYSYSFGGEISDITTSYLPISSTQIGQYPITVFTSNGIFALEQGGTSTLYSNIVPLQPTIAQGKATSTPSGTFFVSSNNIYMMVGRAMVNISEALDGEIDNDLKANMAFNRLCCSTDDKLYDFSNLLSRMEFRNIIANATLVYDQLHNELYISSNDESIQYSYVFNLDTKVFHKTSKKYLATQNGTRYAIEIIGGVKSIVDMHNESHNDMQYILLQSRPLPIDLASTHIQRLLFFVDTKLSGSQNICISVFGSDNLHDWKCIISAQKRNTILRQIRTNKAAKSFRDYIVLINGTVDTNTDISDIIADFTVVNRRLG